MRAILGCVAVVILTTGLTADDKKPISIDVKKLVGKWEPKEKKEDRKIVIEFAKDGIVVINATNKGTESKAEGTYKVDGNKLAVTLKIAGVENAQTRTVSKLTDSEMVSTDDKGKEDTLVRIKDK